MSSDTPVTFRYEPKRCALLDKHVWAIQACQADGTWKIVNCLDKDESCFTLECAFTSDHGAWPYPKATSGQASKREL